MTTANRVIIFFISVVIAPLFIGAAVARDRGPPPDRYESHPSAKRHGYVWSPGYWQWSRHQYVWVTGQWLRERPGYRYQAPRWVHRHGRWQHEQGRWDRYRDSDGDGVPNRHDRRPNDRYRY
jgi:WXXGXW repeat (2 copies)